MKGFILNNNKRYYTYLKEIFKAINNEQLNYNWLITEVECCPSDSDLDTYFYDRDYSFMTGKELTKMIEKEDFQWIWGVFSGFNKDKKLEEILKYELPHLDYSGYWHNPITIQHPLADVELSAWDSSYTVIISKNDNLIKDYNNYFKDAKDLEKYNEELKKK